MAPWKRISRRNFLVRGLSVLTGAPYIIPASACGSDGRPGANSRISLAFIGNGGMGTGLMRSFLWHDDVQVVAVCDVDAKRRRQARTIVEKHYAKHAASGRYTGCNMYGDFREVLARTDIDAVVVATPDHWHVPISLAAARAGKDIYCEKPLTLTIAEGRVLVDTVRACGCVLQTGSMQRSSRNFRYACELARNERIGKLHTIKTGFWTAPKTDPQPVMPVPNGFDYDMWLGPAPWAPYTKKRCHYQFRWNFDYSGGKMTDWGAHHNDIAQWGNNTDLTGPVEIDGKGIFPDDGLYNTATNYDITYRYANGVILHCSDKERAGVTFEGDKGWVFVNRKKIESNPKSLIKSIIGPNEIHLETSTWHHGNFIDCIRTRRNPITHAEIGHRSATVCHLGNISMRLGRKLKWDPERETFVADAEANRMIGRAMRAPWHL